MDSCECSDYNGGSCPDEFWINDPRDIFCELNIVPSRDMSLERQMNAVTRGILLIWIILLLIGHKQSSMFLFISILFVIIIWFTHAKIERFCGASLTPYGPMEPANSVSSACSSNCAGVTYNTTIPRQEWGSIAPDDKLRIFNPSQYRFCKDEHPLEMNQNFYSTNQALAGNPNPKTLRPPPVIAPAWAFDFWAENQVVPPGINDSTNQELYLSGYASKSDCMGNQFRKNVSYWGEPGTDRGFPRNEHNERNVERFERFERNKKLDTSGMATSSCQICSGAGNQSGMGCSCAANSQPDGRIIDWVYDPEQQKYGLPVNLPAGKCQQTANMTEYNKNLFTQTIEPNAVFTRSNVIEPIQSNIGISYTQQFEPVTFSRDGGCKGTYVTHDPASSVFSKDPGPIEPYASSANVYDPRSFGYGTSYRTYVDTQVGQPRFFYDDVDAIRRPNYISRSNIDDAPWALSYGTVQTLEGQNDLTTNVRDMAQAKFIDDSSGFRQELQERLMRKYNTEIGWQRRQAPLRRDMGSR